MNDLIRKITDLSTNKIEILKKVDKPKIGWFSTNIPEEIFYAAGMVPFRITGESDAGTSDASGLLHRNICSYVLSCLSEGTAGVYDFIDGLVFSNTCDARVRLHDVWNHYSIQTACDI